MAEVDDGGPAFPQIHQEAFEGGGCALDITGGASLRDWFAGQALAGIIVADGAQFFHTAVAHAEIAYEHADAMLSARSRPSPKEGG